MIKSIKVIDIVFQDCITAKAFHEADRKYMLDVPGSYYVSVQAVSLSGPGGKDNFLPMLEHVKTCLMFSGWTEFEQVSVVDSTNYLILVILIPIIAVLVIVTGASFIYVKYNRPMQQFTENPSYPRVRRKGF